MKDLYLKQDEEYNVIRINESTKIHCIGHVKASQIIINTSEHVMITGTALTVELDEHNVAIGAPAAWVSYGRFIMPSIIPDIVIDCKEIHTKTRTPNCGIGAYGVSSIDHYQFTENCVIKDTPLDMKIYNEPLQGSTKHSALP